MKLFYAPASPFARKVVVSGIELGLDERIERVPAAANPVDRSPDVVAVNPLGKIPVLQTDAHGVLYDSRVICDYLNSLAGGDRLLPAGEARWDVLRQQALADGILDAALLVRYETMVRPAELQWSDWIDGQIAKIVSALDTLAVEVDGYADRVDLATIGIGCALGYLDFRIPQVDWRAGRNSLADWFARFDDRPSMASTRPFV